MIDLISQWCIWTVWAHGLLNMNGLGFNIQAPSWCPPIHTFRPLWFHTLCLPLYLHVYMYGRCWWMVIGGLTHFAFKLAFEISGRRVGSGLVSGRYLCDGNYNVDACTREDSLIPGPWLKSRPFCMALKNEQSLGVIIDCLLKWSHPHRQTTLHVFIINRVSNNWNAIPPISDFYLIYLRPYLTP